MLLGLTGKKRSGKDSLAGVLVARYGFVRVAFADPLKEAAAALNPIVGYDVEAGPIRLADVVEDAGWERAKEMPEVRRTLQEFGVGIRAIDEDFWTNAALGKVNRYLGAGRDVVITDVRFPNELDLIHGLGGLHVHIERPGLVSDDPHPSETALEPYYGLAEATVFNSGSLDDLANAVDEVLPVLRSLTGAQS